MGNTLFLCIFHTVNLFFGKIHFCGQFGFMYCGFRSKSETTESGESVHEEAEPTI